MATRDDYPTTSRFAADPSFTVLSRKGYVIPTPVFMRTPIRGAGDRLHIVQVRQQFRWDLLSHELLGDVGLRWVLMRHNRIDDPFAGPKAGDRILIPNAGQIAYYLGQS